MIRKYGTCWHDEHLERSPLTLSRLPKRLWLRIVAQQAAITSVAFAQTCQKASQVVNEDASHCEEISLLREIVQLDAWEGPVRFQRRDSTRPAYLAFLPSYMPTYDLFPLRTWAHTMVVYRFFRGEMYRRDIADYQLHERVDRASSHLARSRYVRQKTDVQLRQWNHFQLAALPDMLIVTIVHKVADFRTISRLRLTASWCQELVDSALRMPHRVSFAFSILEGMQNVRVIDSGRRRVAYQSEFHNPSILHLNSRGTILSTANAIIKKMRYWSHLLTEEQLAESERLRTTIPPRVLGSNVDNIGIMSPFVRTALSIFVTDGGDKVNPIFRTHCGHMICGLNNDQVTHKIEIVHRKCHQLRFGELHGNASNGIIHWHNKEGGGVDSWYKVNGDELA